MRILAVDDDPSARELLADFLASRGYRVQTAADGPTALEILSRDPPDLLLLDLLMPGMTGMEVLRRMPESARTVPVIVITAVTEEDVGRAALRAGAKEYVTKPLDLPHLEEAILAVLQEAERERN